MKLRLNKGEGLAPDLIAQTWLPRGDRNLSSQILKSSEAREIQKVKENPGSGWPLHGGTVQGRPEEPGSLTGECAGEAGGDSRPGPGRLPLPGLSAVLCTGLRGRSGLMRVRAGGLSLVLRVGSSPQGHQGQRGDRGDPGQGPALGLLAAQGTTQGPQAPGPLHSHRGPSWGDRGLGETHPAGCGPSGPDRELEEKL